MKQYRYVGASVLRHDGEAKAMGTMCYTGDIQMNGMVYGALVISKKAHAEIVDIVVAPAMQVPGVLEVILPEDLPNNLISSHVWMDGIDDIADEPLLTRNPKHYGDRVAIVVATTEEAARVGAAQVQLRYKELPVVLTIDEALSPEAVSLHSYGNAPLDVVKEFGDAEAAMSNAAYVVEDCIETGLQHHGAIENHVCLAYMDNGVLTLLTPCQITYQVQMLASVLTGLPQERVRVIKQTTGGSFGGKSQPVMEPLCAVLAHKLGRPVMMKTDREQSIVSTRRRNSIRGNVRAGFDTEGKLLSREFDVVVDTGAYYGNGTAVSMAMMKKSFRLYDMDAQRYRARAVVTNSPVAGAARGYGSPQIHAVSEINMENAARVLGVDPLTLRLKNIFKPFMEDPLGGPNLGNAGIEECLCQGAERFGWQEKYWRTPDTGRFRRGVGMAALVHGNGYFGAYPEFTSVDIRLTSDGGIIVNTALHDLGCGTITIMQQIIAEALGMDIRRIRVLESDTQRSPYDPTGTQACRITYVCGEAARLAAQKLKESMLDKASRLLKCPVDALSCSEDGTFSSGSDCLSLKDLARRSAMELKEGISVHFDYEASGNPGSYGANFAEVIVDTWTGFVDVIRIVAAHDIGKAINPEFVKGQIYGGIQMNLGYALSEEIELNSDGTVKSTGFSKYHLINAPSMPPVEIILIEKDEPGGPFGAKSIGEACSVATAPAVINAINHALGTRISKLPATPERIVEAFSG